MSSENATVMNVANRNSMNLELSTLKEKSRKAERFNFCSLLGHFKNPEVLA